jgi:hypothetical protein
MEIKYGETKVHNWTILGEDVNPKFFYCRCELCKNERRVNKKNLKAGLTKSCGCFTKATTHGMSRSRTYRRWQTMLLRTRNNTQYLDAGITVCERWHKFENFLADMGECPPDKKSLDRFPNRFGNYEPGNCRWATDEQQQRNKTNTKMYKHDGKEQSASDWAEEYSLTRNTLLARIDRGWSMERALNTPQGMRRGRGSSQTKDRLITYKGREQTIAQWAEEFELSVSTMADRVFNGWSMERIERTPQGSRGGYNKGLERRRQIRTDTAMVQDGTVLLKYITVPEACYAITQAISKATELQLQEIMNRIYGGDDPVLKWPDTIANQFCVSDHRAQLADVPTSLS